MRFLQIIALSALFSLCTTTSPQKLEIEETVLDDYAKNYVKLRVKGLLSFKKQKSTTKKAIRTFIKEFIDILQDDLEYKHPDLGDYYLRVEVDSVLHDELLTFLSEQVDDYIQELEEKNRNVDALVYRRVTERIKHQINNILMDDHIFGGLANYIGKDLHDQIDSEIAKMVN